jgi:hypothetical protein
MRANTRVHSWWSIWQGWNGAVIWRIVVETDRRSSRSLKIDFLSPLQLSFLPVTWNSYTWTCPYGKSNREDDRLEPVSEELFRLFNCLIWHRTDLPDEDPISGKFVGLFVTLIFLRFFLIFDPMNWRTAVC